MIYTPPDDNLTIVDIQVGTGPVILSGNERKILRFQPAEALSIQDVQSLTIHLQGSDTQSAPAFLVELWNPYEGSWTSLQPRLGDTRVSYPNNYVLPEGDIYIAIRNMTGLPLEMQDLTIQVVIMDQNGNLAFYGTE